LLERWKVLSSVNKRAPRDVLLYLLFNGGRWKVEGGRWKVEDGRWKVEDGRWKMEGGRWKVSRWCYKTVVDVGRRKKVVRR